MEEAFHHLNYRSFGPKGTSKFGFSRILGPYVQSSIHCMYIVAQPDFHGVCPACDVPLGPKLRYSLGLGVVQLGGGRKLPAHATSQ